MAIEFNEIKKEIKKRQWKENLKEKAIKVRDWAAENRELAIGILTIVVSGTASAGKALHKRNTLRKQAEVKDLYCYDNRLGHYWKLRRELSNDEWLEIDRRKRNGDNLSDILAEFKVLK